MQDNIRPILIDAYGYMATVGATPRFTLTTTQRKALRAAECIDSSWCLTLSGEMRIRGIYVCRYCGQEFDALKMQSSSQCAKCQRAVVRRYDKHGPVDNRRGKRRTPVEMKQAARILDDFYKMYNDCQWFDLKTDYDYGLMMEILPQLVDFNLKIDGNGRGRFVAIQTDNQRRPKTIIFNIASEVVEDDEDIL